jgi:hypothetical protein
MNFYFYNKLNLNKFIKNAFRISIISWNQFEHDPRIVFLRLNSRSVTAAQQAAVAQRP